MFFHYTTSQVILDKGPMTTTKSPGDAGLVDSLSESMSFVVTEDIINALDEAASSENTMSRSQFAQVWTLMQKHLLELWIQFIGL